MGLHHAAVGNHSSSRETFGTVEGLFRRTVFARLLNPQIFSGLGLSSMRCTLDLRAAGWRAEAKMPGDAVPLPGIMAGDRCSQLACCLTMHMQGDV